MIDFIMEKIVPVLSVITLLMLLILTGFCIFGYMNGNIYTTRIEITKDLKDPDTLQELIPGEE